jgi:aldehyde dehydrogenase (NAD+)
MTVAKRIVGAVGKEPYSDAAAKTLTSRSPIDNSELAQIEICSDKNYERIITEAQQTFLRWRELPAPKRGEIVRQIGEALRAHKKDLGALITAETGKILAEGEGEVQEAIDIADFAVGLSRQLYGKQMHSERPDHRMMEQWHPLGVVGVISAFNFPMAVWAWNAMLATVCGDVVVWKPSELAPLSAVRINEICWQVAAKNGYPGLFSLMVGDGPALGEKLAADRRVPLISATGSTRMGRAVGQVVAARFGRSILELGGNNAVTILDDADLSLVIPSTVFGSVGTAGQRCTTTRRLLVQQGIFDQVVARLKSAYAQVKIGDPRQAETLMGPLINERAVTNYKEAIKAALAQGGELIYGGEAIGGNYVQPTLIKARADMPIVREETFAPILYILAIKDLDQAIAINNDVPQGLSSSIFTRSVQSAERYLSARGSDCGIANVNIGTSGAEIGGAFGGEKETGGGRESGSDSWQQYMRRQTNTINWSNALPLAQGIKFEVG